MSTITVALEAKDLEVLQAFTKSLGISAEEYMARRTHEICAQLARPLHPDTEAAVGSIAGGFDAEQAYKDYLEEKYQ